MLQTLYRRTAWNTNFPTIHYLYTDTSYYYNNYDNYKYDCMIVQALHYSRLLHCMLIFQHNYSIITAHYSVTTHNRHDVDEMWMVCHYVTRGPQQVCEIRCCAQAGVFEWQHRWTGAPMEARHANGSRSDYCDSELPEASATDPPERQHPQPQAPPHSCLARGGKDPWDGYTQVNRQISSWYPCILTNFNFLNTSLDCKKMS